MKSYSFRLGDFTILGTFQCLLPKAEYLTDVAVSISNSKSWRRVLNVRLSFLVSSSHRLSRAIKPKASGNPPSRVSSEWRSWVTTRAVSSLSLHSRWQISVISRRYRGVRFGLGYRLWFYRRRRWSNGRLVWFVVYPRHVASWINTWCATSVLPTFGQQGWVL